MLRGQSVVVTCEPERLLVAKSLVISSSSYDKTVGAVASLTVGTSLPFRDPQHQRSRGQLRERLEQRRRGR